MFVVIGGRAGADAAAAAVVNGNPIACAITLAPRYLVLPCSAQRCKRLTVEVLRSRGIL